MQSPPLTHHDILGLVEPFARRGRHVDLAASNRVERQLVFKPVDHPAIAPSEAGLRETLQLDCFASGSFRLTRVLVRSDGLQATLQAVGSDCAEMLARFETVELAGHFQAGAGYTIVRHLEFENAAEGAAPPAQPVLSQGLVHVDGLVLRCDIPAMRGGAADLTLSAPAENRPALPDDLLAVLGWDWTRLVPHPDGWTSRLRLRGGRGRRAAAAGRALERAATHLAQVLREPPRRYHERHAAARWGAMLRRSIPTITALGMIVGAYLLTRQPPSDSPGMWLAMHYVSIGLLAFSFCLQELPRFELPTWPRRSRAAAWREAFPAEDHGKAEQGEACSATR